MLTKKVTLSGQQHFLLSRLRLHTSEATDCGSKAGRPLDMLLQFAADLVPVCLRTDEAVNIGPLIYGGVEAAHTKPEKTRLRITAAEERRTAPGAGQVVATPLAVVVQVLFACEDAKRFLPDGGVGGERRAAVLSASGAVAVGQHLKIADFIGDGSTKAASEIHIASPAFPFPMASRAASAGPDCPRASLSSCLQRCPAGELKTNVTRATASQRPIHAPECL